MFIFDIQHFCTHDGPGIRTTVFLKGCPLRCSWCHNPESQSFAKQVLYHQPKCLHCGACNGRHYEDASICQYGAMEECGRETPVEQILQEVLQDETYYRHSGGGLTISGGEPLAQACETAKLLTFAREAGVNTAVETSGCGKKEDYLAIASVTDLFIWDVKLMDEQLYREHTGGNLSRMLDNLSAVSKTGARLLLRFLFIPEIHLDPVIIGRTRELAARFPSAGKEVIPYHVLGNSKRVKLGLPELRFREPEKWETEYFTQSICSI